MSSLVYILIACFIISLLALIGFVSVLLARSVLDDILTWLISFAAGTLVGGAFFHLLPESVEVGGPTFSMAVLGIVTFFAIENFLYAFFIHAGEPHHSDAHGAHHHVRPVGILNLMGDGVHNMIDGVIVASGFLAGTKLGLVTALAVALHEVPQEIGDFAVLVYSGYKPLRALILNYLAALTIFIGAIGFFLFSEAVAGLVKFAVPFAAGGFIYIANADLLAEIKAEQMPLARRLLLFGAFVLGVALLWYLRVLLAK